MDHAIRGSHNKGFIFCIINSGPAPEKAGPLQSCGDF